MSESEEDRRTSPCDADVADARRAPRTARARSSGRPKSLTSKRARDVEALGHHRRHLGVEVVGLPGDHLQPSTDAAAGKKKSGSSTSATTVICQERKTIRRRSR